MKRLSWVLPTKSFCFDSKDVHAQTKAVQQESNETRKTVAKTGVAFRQDLLVAFPGWPLPANKDVQAHAFQN
ncbi:MAG: hypothetical protein R3C20_02275 [Planctomycetaceae bacterium]